MTAPLAILVGFALEAWTAMLLAAAAWCLMAIAYAPTVRLYELSPLWGFTLPLAAFLYTLMTVDSAWRHWQGRGGAWKGRLHGGLAHEPDGSDPSRAIHS